LYYNPLLQSPIIKKLKKNSLLNYKHYLCILILIFNFFKMSKGTVKFFNDSKGFGFITEEGSGKEHFVHISGVIDEIREGDEVEFELTEGKKGLNAVNVRVL